MWFLNFVAVNPGLCTILYIVSFWIMVSLMVRLEDMGKVGRFWALTYTAVVAFITFSSVGGYFQLLSDKLTYV